MRHLELTEIARADLKSIRRYSQSDVGSRSHGSVHGGLRDTLKGLLASTVVNRNRDDLRPGLQMATSGRHRVFFEADQSRILVARVLHDRMDYQRHLGAETDRDIDQRGLFKRHVELIYRNRTASALDRSDPSDPGACLHGLSAMC